MRLEIFGTQFDQQASYIAGIIFIYKIKLCQ